jgi:FAD:protein FMN transferase
MTDPILRYAARACLPLLLLASVGCGAEYRRRELARETWPAMGAFLSVTVPPEQAAQLPDYARRGRQISNEMEERLSRFRPASEISRINREAGGPPLRVSADTARLLTIALREAQAARGAFDPTVAPLVELWGFGGKAPVTVPAPAKIRAALAVTGYSHIYVETEGPSAQLGLPGMALDLGGIAKGYAVDRVFEEMAAAGRPNFMVNMAGNLRVMGGPDGPGRKEPWKIGVRNPFDESEILGVLRLTDGAAVATSGNYERFVEIDGKRFAHIVDPRTGRPVAGMAGVTVVAPSATVADALSTALYVLGPQEGAALLRTRPDCEALFVPDRQPPELWITPGFAALFTPDRAWTANLKIIEKQ